MRGQQMTEEQAERIAVALESTVQVLGISFWIFLLLVIVLVFFK